MNIPNAQELYLPDVLYTRTEKNGNYTVISNIILKDTKISFKAKGIFIHLLSKPDNWEVRISEIERSCCAGREAIVNGLKELEDAGYIHKYKVVSERGLVSGIVKKVYEKPLTETDIAYYRMRKGDNTGKNLEPIYKEKMVYDSKTQNSVWIENAGAEKNIMRICRTSNYTVISNQFLKNKTLSPKAWGIFAYLLSKPDNWEVRISDLERVGTDRERAIRSGLKELEKAGYVYRYRVLDAINRFAGSVTFVYEEAVIDDSIDFFRQDEGEKQLKPVYKAGRAPVIENNQEDTEASKTHIDKTSTDEKSLEEENAGNTVFEPQVQNPYVVGNAEDASQESEGGKLLAENKEEDTEASKTHIDKTSTDEKNLEEENAGNTVFEPQVQNPYVVGNAEDVSQESEGGKLLAETSDPDVRLKKVWPENNAHKVENPEKPHVQKPCSQNPLLINTKIISTEREEILCGARAYKESRQEDILEDELVRKWNEICPWEDEIQGLILAQAERDAFRDLKKAWGGGMKAKNQDFYFVNQTRITGGMLKEALRSVNSMDLIELIERFARMATGVGFRPGYALSMLYNAGQAHIVEAMGEKK